MGEGGGKGGKGEGRGGGVNLASGNVYGRVQSARHSQIGDCFQRLICNNLENKRCSYNLRTTNNAQKKNRRRASTISDDDDKN